MKTATIPPIRVEPDLRLALEGVLREGESISEFVEQAVRNTVHQRLNQAEFVRRGIAAIELTKSTGTGIAAELVIEKLQAKLEIAKQTRAARSR